MPSRRFHDKRRYGCKQCKARRVKCDAAVPCQHCIRRQEPCSNVVLVVDEAAVPPCSVAAKDSSFVSPLEMKGLSSVQTGAATLGISHLELRLFDHYCNVVAPIISAHDHLRRMWQYEIPHQAKLHSFLMHNILSTSAYHLCCAYARPLQLQQARSHGVSPINEQLIPVSPSHRISPVPIDWAMRQSNCYEHFALEQQRLAFQTYIPSLHALGRHNQEAICAASALFSLNALASTQKRYCSPIVQPQYLSPIDDWLEISVLVRGVDTIVKNAGASILDGPLQPLLRHRRIEASRDDTEHDFETQIENQIKSLVSPYVLPVLDALKLAIDEHVSNETDKGIFQKALGFLRASFAIVAVNPDHESILMVWSNLLDDEFFPLVQRREPMALVLLAYWTVLFGAFRDRWWLGSLNLSILRQVAELLTTLPGSKDGPRDGYVQEGDCASIRGQSEQCLDGVMHSTTSKTKWADLLQWPLRESGIHDI